ncbi:hypothetical protein FH972_024678 [Carpinus fangiana]|uniref:Aromatic-L-amino-acid decarboxylase n=1 Tax=Carpinus fangiana TaxID=176857 RepID=A0A5N6KZ49_9ROSI|nr:hypothetical protein FH972_024678 [Carpinus fangiana]
MPNVRVVPNVKPGFLAPQLPAEAPQHPEDWSVILKDVRDKIMPGLTNWQSPNFLAFFPAGVTYPSILGEIFSAAFNAPAFNWLCSPVCTEMETVVLDQLAKSLGLPEEFLSSGEGGGVIQGSASEAIVVAMVAARERSVNSLLAKEGLLPVSPDDSEEIILKREDRTMEIRSKLVALGSSQSHSSTQKAAMVLGVRYRTIQVGHDTGCALTAEQLSAAVAKYESQGLVPFYVTATIGTTSTCAVDDLAGITEYKRSHEMLWVHIDAAYAGAALICPELRGQCQAQYLKHVDSFDVNMHKWLLVNFDASCMYVRRRADLIDALSISPSYLLNPAGLSGLVKDYRDWQIPLGRRFRSLKIWFVLRSYGIQGMQDMVREHIRIGEVFGELCRSQRAREAGIVVVAGPVFALNVFRILPQPVAGNAEVPSVTPVANDFTNQVYEAINDKGDIYLTHSLIDGIDCIRVVGANPNTQEKYLRRAFDIIVETTEEIRGANHAIGTNGHLINGTEALTPA